MPCVAKNKNNKVDMDKKGHNKQWAHKYINEPLTAPEPFQELGRAYSARKQFTISCPAISRLSTGRYPSNIVLDDFNLYPNAAVAKQILSQVTSDVCSIAPTMATASSSSSQHRRVVSAGNNTHKDSGEGRMLDTIKRESRMADRRHRKRFSNADIIDRLDMSGLGPAYHHEGPYDAALAGYNTRKKYSPLEAVRNSNREAIQATPREYMRDCLDKHYPLQGTATIPSGSFDSQGNMMTYREGADLMREPDAAGGAYRRYEGVKYHPDDLKGKGEPSFTLERDLKLRERKMLAGKGNEVEMQSLLSDGVPRTIPESEESSASRRNQKGSSVAQVSGYAIENGDAAGSSGEGVKRRLSNGIRKRFGSVKRKVLSEEPTAA